MFAHFTGGEVTDVIIEAAQDLFAAIKLDDVGAESVEDGRELAGDVAAAYDHQPGRKDWQIKDTSLDVTTCSRPVICGTCVASHR